MDDGLPTQSSFCQVITVVGPPQFSLGDDTSLCQGDSLLLQFNGQGSPLTLLWQDGSTSDTFLVHQGGVYSLTVSGAASCSTTDSVQINYISLPVINTLPDTSLCAGTGLLLATSVQGADSVKWNPAAGLSNADLASPITSPSLTTQYIVTAFRQGCQSRDSVIVTVLDSPTLNINTDTLICKGTSVSLNASGAAQYAWSSAQTLSDATIADPVATPDSSGYFFLKGTLGDGCSSRDSIWIHVKYPDSFGIAALPPQICPGDSTLLKISGGDASEGDTYSWLSEIGPADPHSAEISVSPAEYASYQAVGFDKICNLTDTLTVSVNVLQKPEVTIAKSNDIGCVYGEATLNATGGVAYVWSPAATLSDPALPAPVARTDTTTLYQVIVIGEDGCTATDTIRVVVTKGASIGFPVANAFTPNGDGVNDCFGIKYWGYIGEFELSIFNRWGQRLFYTKNPDECWDGTYGGKAQPAGTYVYMIKAFALCGQAVKQGTVELIR